MKMARLGGVVVRVATTAGIALATITVSPAAMAFSKRVEKACQADYKNLCPQYRASSPQLRSCMESKANEISWTCKQALIDSGEVDRRTAKR